MNLTYPAKKTGKKKRCSSTGWRSNHLKSNLCSAAVMSIAYASESLQTLKIYTHTRSRPSPQPESNQEMAMDISWYENPYFLLFGVLMSLLLVLAARVFLVLRNTGKPISPVSSQRPLHTLFVLGSGMPFLQSRPFFFCFWVLICLHFGSVFFLASLSHSLCDLRQMLCSRICHDKNWFVAQEAIQQKC
jgi:hypothetical protein